MCEADSCSEEHLELSWPRAARLTRAGIVAKTGADSAQKANS